MKITVQNLTNPATQPVFHRVAENRHQLESSGKHYAFIKKGGKQFRRPLKTKDRKLADRRLKELKRQIGCLTLTMMPNSALRQRRIAGLKASGHTLAAGTIAGACIGEDGPAIAFLDACEQLQHLFVADLPGIRERRAKIGTVR